MRFYSMYRFILIISLNFFLMITSQAQSSRLSLDLQHANLSDAIHLIATFLNINVIISPSVKGSVSLHLHDANPTQVLDLLLISHGLAKWPMGGILFIAPREELIKSKQDELKWQEIWDEALPLKTHLWQIKYGKAEEIAHLLHDEHATLLSKRGVVRVDARTNSLYIQEVTERIDQLQRLIQSLDVPVKQILIEARLASVDHDVEGELGIHFGVKSSTSQENNALTMGQEAGSYSVAVAKLADGSLLDVKLSALEKTGQAELISNPSLFTANQQTASIESGEEVPYQEVSDSGGTAVVFKKAVLGLKVTPQVLPGNKVLLQLEISQDRPSNRMVLGVPTISTRRIVTSVLVTAGETLVLGGIYETNQEKGQERLPWISQIPVLGWLFTQQHTRDNKRELLIFVTPKLMMRTNEKRTH